MILIHSNMSVGFSISSVWLCVLGSIFCSMLSFSLVKSLLTTCWYFYPSYLWPFLLFLKNLFLRSTAFWNKSPGWSCSSLIYSSVESILLLVLAVTSFVSTVTLFMFDISTWLFLHDITNSLTDQVSDKPVNQLMQVHFGPVLQN